MKFTRAFIITLFMSLAGFGASADTLNATQVGNISTMGTSASKFLTVNYQDGRTNIGLIQFDLTGYSAGVSSAVLNLYHMYNPVPGATFSLFVNTSPWVNPLTSWAGRPMANVSVSGIPGTSLSISDSNIGLWRSIDVTAAANAWATGALPNYGFTLMRIGQNNPLAMFSASGDFAPTLNVTAAVPEPETYAMFLAGLGLMSAVARRRKQK